jgi:calcium-dependent protein kinase
MGCGSITTFKINSTKLSTFSSLHRKSLSDSETLSQFYTILKQLGSGSFSKVFLARQNQSNHLRALKVVSKELVKNYQISQDEKFLEGEILKELDHPNIIKCFEVFENDESFFLSQEYVDGCNLREYLNNNKSPLSEEKIASLIKQLLQALCYCHTRGIIHRDIKLENLFITSDPKLTLKLGDFGCASLKKDLDSETLAGTMTYMSPEVFEGKVTEKVDIWACGVVLFILITGCSPYSSKNKKGLLAQICLNPVSSKRAELRNCSDELTAFLDKLVKKNPAKRYSAQEALNDPWMVKMQKNSRFNQVLMDQVIGNSTRSWIQKVFTVFYNKTFAECEDFRKINKIFSIIDNNHNGFIEKNEFAKYLRESLGKDQANLITRKFFKEYDLNSNHFIDYSEFVCSFARLECKINRKNIEKVFRVIDFKQDGVVGVVQINEAFQVDITKTIQNRYKDQSLNIDEFVDLIMNF